MQEVQRECYARARTNDADRSFAALQHIIDVTTRLHETMADTSADLRLAVRTEMAAAHGQLTTQLERVRKEMLDVSKIRDDAWAQQVRNAVASFGQDLATHLGGVMTGLRDDARAVFGQEAAVFQGEMQSSLREVRRCFLTV